MTRYFGIDPGSSGGLAYLESSDSSLQFIGMPKTEQDLWGLLSHNITPNQDYAVVEEVSGYVSGSWTKGKDGKDYAHGGQPASRAFVFGQSYGLLRMGLIASGLTEGEHWRTVRPQTWHKWLRKHLASRTHHNQTQGAVATPTTLPPRNTKESRGAFKTRLRDVAKSLFPDYADRITLKTADSILLALYCRCLYEPSVTLSLWS